MITSVEPKVEARGRYTVAQTCKVLGICRNSLFKYTQEGRIKCLFRADSYRKLYEGKEILRFWSAVV